MPPKKIGRSAGKSAPPQFVVLQTAEIGVQPTRGGAFAQVDEGFQGALRRLAEAKLKLTLLFLPGHDKG
ncbi:MAG TPA: hypothetical protein PKK01_10630, partial [Mycobacterium sp.]|nr:hypothetical protein [Mycobacterium sp.]HQE16734.1 hypothetical protein [Mycobacterium sp.]